MIITFNIQVLYATRPAAGAATVPAPLLQDGPEAEINIREYALSYCTGGMGTVISRRNVGHFIPTSRSFRQ
jgi:hypothetical protein